jgi:hypothetical protein
MVETARPPPESELERAAPPYMRKLIQDVSTNATLEEDASWDWARNKLVAFIGDSHDRNNVQ